MLDQHANVCKPVNYLTRGHLNTVSLSADFLSHSVLHHLHDVHGSVSEHLVEPMVGFRQFSAGRSIPISS